MRKDQITTENALMHDLRYIVDLMSLEQNLQCSELSRIANGREPCERFKTFRGRT